ncbi:MAG: hypothetical protein V1492_06080 [Candidatus Micrarchaeota archaeon]
MVQIIPAILCKTIEELNSKITRVAPYVKTVQLDMMDGKFVPNATLLPQQLPALQKNLDYEFHWMYQDPEPYLDMFPKSLHLVNVEILTMEKWKRMKKKVKRLGITINPPTPFESLLPYINETNEFLVMTVNPGFSGQKYIVECEEKMHRLRKLKPKANIEVDGGVDAVTAKRAVAAGANKLVVASALFARESIKEAIADILSSL